MTDVDIFTLAIGAFLFSLLVWATIVSSRRQSRREKAKTLDVMLYGILEHRTDGARTWLTPFDITSEGAAFAEAINGLVRDDDIDFCTIFVSKNGETPSPLFTVGRPDLDTLKPHA